MKLSSKVGLVIFFVAISDYIYTLLSPIYKALFMYTCIFGLLPILMMYLRFTILELAKKDKVQQKKVEKKEVKFQPKVIENSSYELLRDCFKDMIQGKQLSNSQVVAFLCQIDVRLADHLYNYRNFKFNNQAHEIYTKLKSSKFKEEDYRILYSELIRISQGLEEVEEDYFSKSYSN